MNRSTHEIPRTILHGLTICICFIWFTSLPTASLANDAPRRPNVVYIMADDLGIGDVKCYGKDLCLIDTPALDSLADDGMRFTDAHSVCSVCVPSRIAIMTGRYPWRFQRPFPNGPWGFLNPQIPTADFTLGKMLRRIGYRTAYVGKWHLGTLMQTLDGKLQGPDNVDFTKPLEIGPLRYGFDFSFILPASLDMYPYAFVRDGRFVGPVTARKSWSAFHRLGPAAEDFEDYKVLDTLTGEAVQFISRHAETANDREPFFLYFALTSPHTPTCPSPAFEGKSQLGLYGDFVEETDDCVGRILKALEQHGLVENTLVIATSDHGPAPYAGNVRPAITGNIHELERLGHYPSGGFRGYKFSVYEGGLRVPYLVRWPAVVKPNSQCDRLIGLNDLAQTLADICDHELPEEVAVDSISFLPLLHDPNGTGPRRSLVMQSSRNFVIRHGDWKLALCPGSGSQGMWGNEPTQSDAWRQALTTFAGRPSAEDLSRWPFVQLFDLRHDVRETTNLAADHPERVEELIRLLGRYVKQDRGTPGKTMPNDKEPVNYHARIPPFVVRP